MKKTNFLTFISSLIPGIGYIYLGLVNKGIETLILFFIAVPILRFIGMNFLASLMMVIIWVYSFIDTNNLARRINMGEYIPDIGIFKSNIKNTNSYDSYEEEIKIKKNRYKVLGWVFVIIGILSVINKAFEGNDLYYVIRAAVRTYIIPVAFIIVGIYMLIKNKHNE